MKRIFFTFLAAFLLLSGASCGTAPDTAVDERLVETFPNGLSAIEVLGLEDPVQNGATDIYREEFFWCGEKLETDLYFDHTVERATGFVAEQTLEVGEGAEARVQECLEQFGRQFGAMYNLSWKEEDDRMGVALDRKNEAEIASLVNERLAVFWDNPEANDRMRFRYVISDTEATVDRLFAELEIEVLGDDPSRMTLTFELTNWDYSGYPANTETGAE